MEMDMYDFSVAWEYKLLAGYLDVMDSAALYYSYLCSLN